MKAEILAVGSELLVSGRVETNAAYLSGCLREIGIDVRVRSIVADDKELLRSAFAAALDRSELVISTGGLGPTEDDLTREAAAAALGLPLKRSAEALSSIRARFERFHHKMAPVNEKQADLIAGGTLLPNANGTAPGQWIEWNGRYLALLPGPPAEMTAMFAAQVLPLIRSSAGDYSIVTRVLRVACVSESEVEQITAPLYTRTDNPRTTILGGPAQVELLLTGQGRTIEDASSRIEELAAQLRERLGDRVFSEDGRGLHEIVASELIGRGLTLALAESCTGGLLSARLTSVPGASRFFERAFVTYTNAAKAEALGVDSALLATHGAVSSDVAQAMAEGAQKRARASIGVAITGIAGPEGGSERKPVGLVFTAIAGAAGERTLKSLFPGDRERVRAAAVQTALEMLRRGLLGLPPLSGIR